MAKQLMKMVDGEVVPMTADEVALKTAEDASWEAGRGAREAETAEQADQQQSVADRLAAIEAVLAEIAPQALTKTRKE